MTHAPFYAMTQAELIEFAASLVETARAGNTSSQYTLYRLGVVARAGDKTAQVVFDAARKYIAAHPICTAQTLPSGTVDTDILPKDNGVCSNCWCSWVSHVGWRCPNFSHKGDKYSELPENGRYKTGATKTPGDVKAGSIDWRTWRDHGKAADECPCGSRWGSTAEKLKPGECVYHRR